MANIGKNCQRVEKIDLGDKKFIKVAKKSYSLQTCDKKHIFSGGLSLKTTPAISSSMKILSRSSATAGTDLKLRNNFSLVGVNLSPVVAIVVVEQ